MSDSIGNHGLSTVNESVLVVGSNAIFDGLLVDVVVHLLLTSFVGLIVVMNGADSVDLVNASDRFPFVNVLFDHKM